MKILFKPTMLLLYFILIITNSCNKEEVFIDQAIVSNSGSLEDPIGDIITVTVENDTIVTNQNIPVNFNPFANDSNIPANAILNWTNPTAGSLSINDNKTPLDLTDDLISYTPQNDFYGEDNFDYSVCDSVGSQNCVSAKVNISVKPIVIPPNEVSTELKAFPIAYGAGANATGGRGGQVIHVTTLNWSGTGSLKEALQTTGPRTIVFDVSGEIDATSEGSYYIVLQGSQTGSSVYDDLTIAGQTAPAGGITVKVASFGFDHVDNVIIRHVRFRSNDAFDQKALVFLGGNNIIVDHCTFSHGADEAASFGRSSGYMADVTIQNCFFQDSKTGTLLGISDGAGDFTFINNLYSNISHRFPNPNGTGQYDVINNVVYNYKYRLSTITHSGTYNFINNYYKPSTNVTRPEAWLQRLQVQESDTPLIYSAGSIITGSRETPQTDDSDMWTIFDGSYLTTGIAVPSRYLTGTQFPLVGESFTIKTANQAYTDLVVNKDVGAYKTLNSDGSVNVYYDTKDAADLAMIKDDTYNGAYYDAISSISYPTIPENTRPEGYDTDRDGMPDAWETAMFGDLLKDGKGDADGDGYTDLEEFLNSVDK